MVRRIQVVLVSICLVLFFLVSLILLLQMVPWAPVRDFGVQVADYTASAHFLIFLAAIVVVLAIGVLEVRLLRETVLITKEGEEGKVTIVESAITRYIRQVAAEIESVQSVRTKISSTPEGLVVELFAKVLVTDTLPRIEQAIRSRVREALEQTLGVGGVAAINVVVEGFEKVAPRTVMSPAGTSEVRLTGEAGAPPSGESTSARWGRLFHRAETKEPGADEVKPDEAKTDDGKIGS
jgi:uncharacterized alkaline shock family protein YloU